MEAEHLQKIADTNKEWEEKYNWALEAHAKELEELKNKHASEIETIAGDL